MSVRTLIQEAMNKNALGFEEALKEELRNRISLVLEAKMNGNEEEDEEREDDETENEDEDEDEEEEPSKEVKESTQLDEISSKLAANYSIKASDTSKHRKLPTKKVDNRHAGVHMADQKTRKMLGKNSNAKVATKDSGRK
jgi:hypothetical protein